ncbi:MULTISPECIES: ClpXP protease specificity-enhancing factor [unclassified Oleiphilus]|uniref:ClpXP protease specificity-enhancing factor n=1 Tax=unclassified Oleiphilus TaxID=2631174 RepID=UPI0009ED91FF|nr:MULTISPECIES: ClpXP protease specificity-enhancing factor [unclassified Oleiphilus]
MTPSRPYLVRALNQWIIDNGLTPYLVVDAGVQGVHVPEDYVTNGQIILNISPGAVNSLSIEDRAIEFQARFGGVPMQVYVPIIAVMAIYAKENGQGMVFGAEPGAPEPPPFDEAPTEGDDAPSSHKPSLKIVK